MIQITLRNWMIAKGHIIILASSAILFVTQIVASYVLGIRNAFHPAIWAFHVMLWILGIHGPIRRRKKESKGEYLNPSATGTENKQQDDEQKGGPDLGKTVNRVLY